MKILQVIPDLRVGGAERVAINLCQGFVDKGHQVLLVSIKSGGPQEKILPQSDLFSLQILGLQRSSILRPLHFFRDSRKLQHKLSSVLRSFQPDVVQTHIPEDDLYLSRACEKTGIGAHIPIVHSLQFHLHRKSLDLRSRLRLRLFKRALQRAATVLAVSGAVKEKVLELTQLPDSSVQVLHNGVDLRPFQNLAKKDEVRKSLGLPLNRPIIFGVGRFHPAKNYPMFVRASALVHETHPDALFVLVGDGEERAPIEAAIHKTKMKEHWRLLGQRGDVPQCLKIADLFVQSSDWEGFPVAVIEAMAAKLPVIATEVAGVGEVIQHQKNGWLIPPGNEHELADAIRHLLDHPQEAQELAKQAEKLAWEHYNLEAWTRRAESILQRALRSPAPSP